MPSYEAMTTALPQINLDEVGIGKFVTETLQRGETDTETARGEHGRFRRVKE